jgi:2-polyprenyl-3-methyl-5-hydroxy-6-metoxy-1,4-benzoquinol methylase
MDQALTDLWTDYYRKVFESGSVWLDYSNPNVQAQTFAIALEAGGPIGGKRCLDIGCGRGHFASSLLGFAPSDVVGVDIVPEQIEECRKRTPQIRWEVGTPVNPEFAQQLGMFDVIFAIEMLQYVDLKTALRILFGMLNPGGRIVAIIPNKDNQIVQKTIARFTGNYLAPNINDIAEAIATVPNVAYWAYRGMDFQSDQQIVPYATSQWQTTPIAGFTPNRIAFAIKK